MLAEAKVLSLLQSVHLASYSICTLTSEIKRPGREDDHSPPSSTKVKNEWSICLHVIHKDDVYFQFIWKVACEWWTVQNTDRRNLAHFTAQIYLLPGGKCKWRSLGSGPIIEPRTTWLRSRFTNFVRSLTRSYFNCTGNLSSNENWLTIMHARSMQKELHDSVVLVAFRYCLSTVVTKS